MTSLAVSIQYMNATGRQTPDDVQSRAGPDYGIGIVDKCLRPMRSKGSTKDGCKIF